MQSNMSFTSIGFKGGALLNGIPVVAQGIGPRTIGGKFADVASNDNLEAQFGYVMSADPDDPTDFLAGAPAGSVVRGIAMFDPSIAQNLPAKPGYYLKLSPMTVCYEGTLRFNAWGLTATGAAAPAIDSKVIFKNTTGEIEFLPAAVAVPVGWTQLANTRVIEVDPTGRNGVALAVRL